MTTNYFLNLIFKLIPTSECQHDKISPASEGEYCPDCGKYIINEWYITRCKCCGVKLQTVKKGSDVVPAENFCHNCGGSDFFVEKLSKIDFINIHYAVLCKKIFDNSALVQTTQCWEEENSINNIAGQLPFLK